MKKNKGKALSETVKAILADGNEVRVTSDKPSPFGKEIAALNKALRGKKTVRAVMDALSDEIQRLGMDKNLPQKPKPKAKKKARG
jgi:hypothetical protein